MPTIIAVITIVLLLATALAWIAYRTNPFSRLSVIRLPYAVRFGASGLGVTNRLRRLRVRQQWWWRTIAIVNCGLYIISTRYFHSPAAASDTVEGIIGDIHRHRFRPDRLLVVSGDHFTSLFVRNLGVFYYPLLDPSLPGDDSDWQDRQAVYLQTVAYALGVFSHRPVPTTTIVPTGRFQATCVNFYAYPSDTVYGILFALAALSGRQSAALTPLRTKSARQLATITATNQLLGNYRQTLGQLYQHYRNYAYDEASGLISTSVHMSGAKDITKRQAAFYDSVIFWKSTALAMELGIIDTDQAFLRRLKDRILQSYWLEAEGYFLEDLSQAAIQHKYYSSDWLIVLTTGFLDPRDSRERHYFQRSIDYIRQQGIAEPFAIKYQHETRAGRQFLPVRLAVASYGGDAIWSFWGMEYIKVLLLLHESSPSTSPDTDYLREADRHIAAYRQTMVRDGGFPEVYGPDGSMLQTPLYRSIRQTGWVVGFEQVLVMRHNLDRSY